jgi:hypothetical protein
MTIQDDQQPHSNHKFPPFIFHQPINLASQGIDQAQAKVLRANLTTFAYDWNRPEMSIYDSIHLMGTSILYSAIPPTSAFYKRIQTERALATFVATLFPYGGGIFRFFEINPTEANEILDGVIEKYQDIFGTTLEADMWVGEFRDELRRTRKAYPGIEDRSTSLEKAGSKIEKQLVQALARIQSKDVSETVGQLIFGNCEFAPDLLPAGYSLGLVTASVVQEGAELLQCITPNTLFTEAEDPDRWYRKQFEWWKKLYLAVAERDEEIIVAVA